MTGSTDDTSAPTEAWTIALDMSRPYFTAPAARDLAIEFAAEAKRIGESLRGFHEDRAGEDETDDSGPESALPEDLDAWVDSARRSVEAGLTLLDRQLSTAAFAKTRVAEAQALVKRRGAYLARIEELADSLGDDFGVRIHVHGNLSLSGVVRSTSGVYEIVAAAMEPSIAPDRTSPLRDVAAMLRSFGYASATLVAAVEKTSDMATRELRAGRWERDVRAAFLEGYVGDSDEDAPGILPEEPEHVSALIALFETEKAFGDLVYELNNRPTGAWIPMRGIAKLLTR